jgi:hypothetical protein
MKKVFLTAIATLLLLLFPVGAFGCVCIIKSPSEALKEAKAVFSGKIIDVRETDVIVQVEKVWKGELPEKFKLYTGSRSDTCNFRFESGEKYLIYAVEYTYRENDGPILKASKCLGTKNLKYAEKDLKELDKSITPKEKVPASHGAASPRR